MEIDLGEASAEEIAEYTEAVVYNGPVEDLSSSRAWKRINGRNTTDSEMMDDMETILRSQLLIIAGYNEEARNLRREGQPKEHKTVPAYQRNASDLDGCLYFTTSFANMGGAIDLNTLFNGEIVYDGKPEWSQTDVSHGAHRVIGNLNENASSEGKSTTPDLEDQNSDYFTPIEQGAVYADTRIGPCLALGEVSLNPNFNQENWENTQRRLENDVTESAKELEKEMKRI